MNANNTALWVALVTILGGSVALYNDFHKDYITKQDLEIVLLRNGLKP